jgi:hypothetical protein
MSMHEIVLNDRQVSIERMDGIAALPARQTKVHTDLKAIESIPGVDRNSLHELRNAGWTFVQIEDGTQEIPDAAPVYRLNDQLLIGTRNLTLQVDETVPDAAVRQILEPAHLTNLRRLPFAPGLYQATMDAAAADDALALIQQLNATPSVIWVEPEFIEVISSR